MSGRDRVVDDPEAYEYTNDTGGTLTIYLAVDGYSAFYSGSFGLWCVNGGGGIVANAQASWGDVKSFYR